LVLIYSQWPFDKSHIRSNNCCNDEAGVAHNNLSDFCTTKQYFVVQISSVKKKTCCGQTGEGDGGIYRRNGRRCRQGVEALQEASQVPVPAPLYLTITQFFPSTKMQDSCLCSESQTFCMI
jgi:hypothetical protein